MSAFKFHCPHCQQKLEAPEVMFGTVIDCPACNGRIKIPQPAPPDSSIPKASPPAPANIQKPASALPADEEKISVVFPARTAIPPPMPAAPRSVPAYRQMVNAPGATSSLVWGILGFFLCGLIFGCVAISNANKARKLIQEQPDLYTGKGLATAGLVLGIIDFAGWGLVLLARLTVK